MFKIECSHCELSLNKMKYQCHSETETELLKTTSPVLRFAQQCSDGKFAIVNNKLIQIEAVTDAPDEKCL